MGTEGTRKSESTHKNSSLDDSMQCCLYDCSFPTLNDSVLHINSFRLYIMLALFCCHFVVNFQGRNFGVKVGVSIQQENEAPFGPEAREKRMESKCPLLIRLWGLRVS